MKLILQFVLLSFVFLDFSHAAKIKVAAVNFKVNGGTGIKEHFARIDSFAVKANEEGASFLLLPEFAIFDLMAINPKDTQIGKELDILADKFSAYEMNLVKIATKNKITIVKKA